MLRTLKMDLYRLFRFKLTYILLGVTILFTIFMIGTYALLELSIKYMDVETLGEDTVTMVNTLLPQSLDGYIELFFFGNYSIVFIVLFAVLFCSGEYKTGYIKNTAVNILPRYLSYFSKLIIATGYAFVVFAVVFLVVLGGCALLGHTEAVNVGGIVKMILVQFFSNVSLTSFIMMFFYVTRKTSITMVAGLVYSTMGTVVYTLINAVAAVAFPKSDFDLSKFTNLGNMVYHVNTGASTTVYVRAVIVAVVFIGISSFFSCLSINKKDIR